MADDLRAMAQRYAHTEVYVCTSESCAYYERERFLTWPMVGTGMFIRGEVVCFACSKTMTQCS